MSTSGEFPRNLFFDARDRPDLRPTEYVRTANAPRREVDAAAVKLRDEAERRSRLMGRALRDLEQAARAVKQLRDMDTSGFGDTWVDYADAVWGRASASFQALLAAVDAAYERHDEMRDLASVGRDPEPVELETTVVETDADSSSAEEEPNRVMRGPDALITIVDEHVRLEPWQKPYIGGLAPSPADVARQLSRQRHQALGLRAAL